MRAPEVNDDQASPFDCSAVAEVKAVDETAWELRRIERSVKSFAKQNRHASIRVKQGGVGESCVRRREANLAKHHTSLHRSTIAGGRVRR
jgi:hypothetical protein